MADIRLAKPAAGTTQTVPSAPDGRFIFDFPADAATLTRNGDDLVLTFEDGAAIQLQGFYTTYSKEEMPSFQVDGVEISGQDFFAALDEDLMPAAGPASGSSAARGGRYNEYGGSDLLDGLDHLGRLDIGFDGGTQLATDTVEPSPYSEVDHGVTVTPSTPGTDPDDPSIPVQGEDFPPTMPHDVLQVDESALDGGSGGGSATAAGSMRVSAPDGVAIITIGGVVVWQNGALTGNPVLTDEGHLDVTGFDGTNLTYTYTLTGSTQEHAKLNAGGENDAIAHEMAVVVTDRDGDSGSAVIRVEITDDVPTIKSFERDVTEGATAPVEGNALEGSAAGADGADFAWTNPTQQGQYGTITLNPNGSYSYTLDNNNAEVKALTDGQRLTEEFTYTYTDADGDVAEGKVTITINGVNNGVEVGSGTLTVYEAGLDDGSTPGGDNTPTTASGSLHINAPDGVATIAIGEVTVFENGALTSSNTISTDEGVLTVTGFDAATGELTFTYTLNDNTLEHGLDGMDTHVSHDFAVTVTDVDGSRDTGEVTVVITDDGPMVTPVETEYNGKKYVNTVSVSFGADNDTGTGSSLAVNAYDDEGTAIEWTKVGGNTSSGTDLSKLSQGESWTNGNIIVSRENGNFVFKIKENGSNAHIRVTATDADGDTDTEELNLTAPDAGPNAIIVDEALLSDGSRVNSDDPDHEPSGTGSFTVNLNGEDGTVTLKYGTGEDASTITLSLINGDKFKESWLSINKTLTVNGVKVTVTDATQTEPGGPWKIEYTYELTGQQAHKNEGSAGAVGADDALSDSINITVTDATGDMTTGSLMVTVHDDGPVLSDVVAEASQIVDTQSTISLDFSGLSVGADSEGATLTVEVNGTTFTGTQDGAGKWNFTSTDAKVGEAFAMGTGGQFIYTRPEEDTAGEANNSYTFNVTVTDADGDAVSDSVTVTTAVKPGFEGQPSEGSVVDNLVTDDSGLDGGNVSDPDGSGEADSAQDTGSFSVTLNGREYTITLTGKEDSFTLKLDAVGNLKDPASLNGVELEGNYGTLSNISVSGGTISYTYTQTDNYLHDADGNDRDAAAPGADSFGVTVSDGLNDDVSGTISVTIEDDGPGLTVTTDEVPDAPDTPVNNLGSGKEVSFVPDTPEKPDASDYEGGEDDPNYKTALLEYNTAIDVAKQEAEGMAGQSVESDILSENGWDGVSIYAGKVTYNADGTVQELTTPENYKLQYSNYASNKFTVNAKPAADWGIMVASPDDDQESWADDNYETNVIGGNASEAIVIDLEDKLAYGIELSFGAFYSNYHDTEGAEKLLITFYKGSEIVESRFVDSVDIGSSNTGKVTYSTELIAGGFDKVVVSAVLGENGRESSFTLQGVDFVTAPPAIAVASGELDVASGADGYAEAFAVANVQFAMEQMFSPQPDGTYSLSILDGNNDPKSATVTVMIDDMGNSRLTATLDGKELFAATLEKDGDGWSWKMEQYQEFLVQGKDGQLGDLELGFITMDGDDDTATETVNIPLKNLPDLAVSQTTLVTDESYINGLGSDTGPAKGGDGQADSAKASGTMSVKTYGKEGKLILTIGEEEHQFSLDTDGKLSESQELTVTTYGYGQLTLQNGEEPGTIIYTYTQTKPYNHMPGEGPDQLAENAESFTVKVVDGGGNESGSATITVSIEDDAPVVTVKGDVPASLELTESTGAARQTFDASTLFDIKVGADTKDSSTEYELTYKEGANPGLKAIVDGEEYDVTLQLEGGILKGMAGETNIFTISVDESTGKVTLEMTGAGSLKHDGSNGQELHLEGVGVKVTVTDGDDDSTTSDSADLTLTITDDVPTISESQKATITPSSEVEEDIADFDFGNAAQKNDAEWVPKWVENQLPESSDGQVYDHPHEEWGAYEDGYKKLDLTQENHKITFSAAVVQYQGSDGTPIRHGDQDDAAPSIQITDITDTIVSDTAPLLTFVSTAWNKGESGMAVYSGQRGHNNDQSDGEIGAINGQFEDGNTDWEAVKMDLGADNAYSITITLNSFYNTPGDQEKAYIILMNDDKVVDKLLIEGKDAENGIVDSTKFSSAEAFNTVYIVPWGTKSDFLLNGVEVGYSPVTVLKSEGQVEAVSADGIKGYSFGYDQNDVVTVNEKKLTVSVEGDGKTIHFLSSSGDDDTYTKVIVGEATITEAGKWTLNWFDQATNPQQDTDFTLPIIATDGDGDTAEIKVKVVPSEDEVGDSQAADALPEEEEKQPAAEKREGKDGSQGMMDGALLQSSMAAEAAAPRMAAATLLGMALVADAADDVLAAATGTDGMPHADVKADGLSGDIGDAPSTLHMDGAAQSGADAFDATLDSSLFAPGVMDPLADGTESLEGLLPDKEHAPFDAEGLLFTAAAPDLSDDASGLVGKGVASGDVLPPAGEEGILGTEETDVLTGTDDDDILLGGDGDEQIFGGSGDDYIDGGEGRDTIYAGDGNDIIVYDKADYLVSGGSGIDFMVSADSTLTMDTLLSGGKDGHEGPIVDSIEVLITGKDALSLTSIQELADKYGIELGTNPDGQETLTLDMGKWTEQADGSYDFHGGAEEGGLTLETNLQHDSTTSSDNGEMAQQVFILEHTNS